MHCTNVTMWILLYADDISLVCDTAEKLKAVTIMDATFLCRVLTITGSTKKTEMLTVSRNAAAQ